jgi:hypothetical protein
MSPFHLTYLSTRWGQLDASGIPSSFVGITWRPKNPAFSSHEVGKAFVAGHHQAPPLVAAHHHLEEETDFFPRNRADIPVHPESAGGVNGHIKVYQFWPWKNVPVDVHSSGFLIRKLLSLARLQRAFINAPESIVPARSIVIRYPLMGGCCVPCSLSFGSCSL